MKKIIPRLISVIVSLLAPLFIFAETSNLITQLKVVDNDTTYRYLYYYDTNNNKVLETKYYLNGNLWVKKTQTEWLYNNNKCEIQRERVFVSNDWVNVYEINYTYQDNDLISESHSKFINGMAEQYKMLTFNYEDSKLKTKREFYQVNGQLVLKQLIENTYENNLLKSTSIRKISSVQSEMKEYRLGFEYDTAGILTSQLLEEKNNTNQWVNAEKVNWYYNAAKNLVSQRSKRWDLPNGIWENSNMINYVYKNDNQIDEEIYYKWSTMFWERTTKYSNSYNSNGNLLSTTLMLPVYRQWRSVSSIDYSDFVNEKANKMETVLSFWSNNYNAKESANIPFKFNNEIDVKKGNQIIISYEKIDNTDISTFSMLNGLSINIYPNPSEDYFYFNPEDYEVISWNVIDMKGQIIIQSDVKVRSGIIDLSNAPKGVYMLKVKTPVKVLSQKLIKK